MRTILSSEFCAGAPICESVRFYAAVKVWKTRKVLGGENKILKLRSHNAASTLFPTERFLEKKKFSDTDTVWRAKTQPAKIFFSKRSSFENKIWGNACMELWCQYAVGKFFFKVKFLLRDWKSNLIDSACQRRRFRSAQSQTLHTSVGPPGWTIFHVWLLD